MKNRSFPDPEGKINVLKRYLHILALLQYEPEYEGAESWKAAKLAELISKDEIDKIISRFDVNEYIKKHIENELGIDIDRATRNCSMSIPEDLDVDAQHKIANIYANFMIQDTARNIALKKFINTMPKRALWTLARIYFAVIEKRMIQINYTKNNGEERNKWKLCPYYFFFSEFNLYLAAYDPVQDLNRTLHAERINDLVVLEKEYSSEWKIPSAEVLFKYSLSAFLTVGSPVRMKIKYAKNVSSNIDSIISPLNPEKITIENSDWFVSEFVIADYLYLCKQLILYGNNVEILSPPNVRKTMINMLKESLSVYDK